MTDRQAEILRAAYLAGYYAWPRDTTAEELAESLDISSPTLHQHLRRAS
ncbi:helix-turn-helix domain-containing protein [Halomicroarcula sp. GCM10025710]